MTLVRYGKQNPKKTKVSTEIANPNEDYQKTQILGYLLPYKKAGFRPLYDCYIPIWDDYMVSWADCSFWDWEHCESDGDVFVRRIGWISQTQTQDANLPLYRCFDEKNLDHFLSLDQNCEGKTHESLAGYLFEDSFDEIVPGDLNNDGLVNSADIKILLSRYGTDDPEADFNSDGIVNGIDFGIICATIEMDD